MRGSGSLSSRTPDDRKSIASGGSSTASTLVADSLTSSAQRSTGAQSNLRKFTAGVGGRGLAREAREAARNVISTNNPTRKAPLSAPIDYERLLTAQSVQVDNDPQRELLIFPRDDIEETSTVCEPTTAVPAVLPSDMREANWQLTRDALHLYSSPQKSITFNYAKFAGDYNTLHNSSSVDQDVALSSLVFESDMALEEQRAAEEGFFLSDDVINQGFLFVVKSDPSLLDNLKSEKKRRWCILRRLEDGQIAFEVQKTVGVSSGRPLLRINSAQLKATKKGRTVLEVEPVPENEEKGAAERKSLTLAADGQSEELAGWLQIINRALALANKADCVSVSSEGAADIASAGGHTGMSGGGRVDMNSTADTDSIHSEDSFAARDMASWRGRNTAAKALQPPIVDRRNLFSLYHKLAPVTAPKGDGSALLQQRQHAAAAPSSSSAASSLSPPDSPALRKRNGSNHAVSRFCVEFAKLDMKLPVSSTAVHQIEPLFVRLFLFDSAAGRRLSEEFHVDVNDDELAGLLAMGRTSWEQTARQNVGEGREGVSRDSIASTHARKMLCTVAAPSHSTWLVCRVDRVLSADLNGDLYMRTTGDVKATLKLQRQLQAACARLGAYRTRFAFAARPLYYDLVPPSHRHSSDAVSLSSSRSSDPDILQLYRCDGNRLTDTDLQKYLSDFPKFEKTSKLLIPGATVRVVVDSTTKIFDFPLRLSSSYLPLLPWKKQSNEPPVLEVQPFGDVVAEPHSALVNLLYVYPLSLKYDNQKIFSKARNICCTVRFMRGGEDIAKEAWLDRLSPLGPFCQQVSCAVQHHQQTPSFGDEMKMRLPLSLGQYDHLLFTFSHVSVVGQLNARTPTESVDTNVGFAWLPLATRKERLLLEGDEQDFALCVAAELPRGYYRNRPLGVAKGDEASPDVRWVDTKPLFRVRLRLVSSVYSSQPRLQAFFQACHRFETKGTASDAAEATKKQSSPSSVDDGPRSCSPLCRGGSPLDDDHSLVKEMHARTEALSLVDIVHIIPFLPLLLNRLLGVLPIACTDSLAHQTLSALVSVVDRVWQAGRGRLLRSFIRRHFAPREQEREDEDESTHAAIARHLPNYLRSVQADSGALAAVYRQMWFLLDAASKSMAHTIVMKGLFKSSRAERFPTELVEQIGQLVETLTPQMIAKHREIGVEARQANTALAYFMRCCLSFMDRGAVFRWLHHIIERLDESDSRGVLLREYKADLLTVVCQHEHWLPLCLPVMLDSADCIQRMPVETAAGASLAESTNNTATGSSSGILARFFQQLFSVPSLSESHELERFMRCSDEWWLSESYARRHFPVGLLLQELKMCLREPREYRKRPIALVRNLLAKHGSDSRYSDMNYQRRVAILYAPIIRFALDNLPELEASVACSSAADSAGNTTDSSIGARGSKWRSLERAPAPPPSSGRLSIGVYRPPPPPPPPSTPSINGSTSQPQQNAVPLPEKLDSEEVQDILVSLLFVLQRLPKKVAGALWTEGDGEKATQLLRLLEVVLDVFRYRGKAHAFAATEQSARMMHRASHVLSRPQGSPGSFSMRLEEEWPSAGGSAPPFAVLQMLNLSQEVALIVLHVLQTFSQQLASHSCAGWTSHSGRLFSRLLSLHLILLGEQWPEAVRLHSLAALALFVNLFRRRLLDSGPLDALSVLQERLLILIASRLSSVQLAAAALLQILLRYGYENAAGHVASEAMRAAVAPAGTAASTRRLLSASERLGRPGAQTGVALARLLGSTPSLAASGRLEKGLSALDSLVGVHDPRRQSPFDKAVLELTRQLRGVMAATGALNLAKNDPIRLADLHIQLADSYRGSAALRSTWLETLAATHSSARWHAEAAVCQGHAVALAARELAEGGELTAVDWAALDWISKEIAVEEGIGHVARAENIQNAGFTLENLAMKIERTAHYLTQAERYEAIGPLYRIIVPALERNDNFNSLVSVYAELQQSYSRAAEAKASGKRHLGAYFRVRFYGKAHFDADHDTEWIYREQGLTSLAEASQRLGDYCRQIVGHERVQVEPEKELDSAALDEATAYVQVTHVEPVCTEERSPLSFATHTNLSQFSYEKVQIEGGKCEGEPAITQRALRKTLLTVSGAFPSTRRRLRIVKRQEQVFSPLEFACQKLRVKAAEIRSVLSAGDSGRPIDAKRLQCLLQGAVLPTVNAGPLAYAEAFTHVEQRERYGEAGIEQLKNAFKELMSACGAALRANEGAIASDQVQYQEILRKSFEATHERLQVFFGVSLEETDSVTSPSSIADFLRTPVHILDSISGVNTP